MQEVPNKREDPRSPLQKRRQIEMADFARRHNIAEISPDMPARLMRRILNARGIHDLDTPLREPYLGVPREAQPQIDAVIPQPEIDPLDVLEQQWRAQRKPPEIVLPNEFDPETAPIWELKKECKKRGIKTKRTDKIETLRSYLRGQNAA